MSAVDIIAAVIADTEAAQRATLATLENACAVIRNSLGIESREVFVGEWECNKCGGDRGKAVFSTREKAIEAAMRWAEEMHGDRTDEEFPAAEVRAALETDSHYWTDIGEWGVSVCGYTVDEE